MNCFKTDLETLPNQEVCKSNLGRKSAFLPQFNKWDFVCEFEAAGGCLLWERERERERCQRLRGHLYAFTFGT